MTIGQVSGLNKILMTCLTEPSYCTLMDTYEVYHRPPVLPLSPSQHFPHRLEVKTVTRSKLLGYSCHSVKSTNNQQRQRSYNAFETICSDHTLTICARLKQRCCDLRRLKRMKKICGITAANDLLLLMY